MRPVIQGSFGVVTSTHWLGSAAGMAMLERGGNAFDAAVATGLVLQVVEPHLNGPGGDLPAIIHTDGQTRVLCAQGPAPAGATLAHYRAQGLELIPGNGLLATVIPGAFDGWMTMLRDYGTMELADVLEPAIHYAEHGHPILPRAAAAIAGLADFFRAHWPGSAATWLPDGQAPQGGRNFRNPTLAATWRRLLTEARGQNREARINAARDAFYRGFVAEQIDRFCQQPFMDESGAAHAGVLTGADMAGYAATWEAPLTLDFHGWQIAKAGPWTQGPAFLQTLALMAGDDLAAMDPLGPDYLHLLAEAMKLAFADRETYYGDPDFSDIPVAALLSADYNRARRTQIEERASYDLRPGVVPGFEAQVTHMRALLDRLSRPEGAVYEPTMAHLGDAPRGDTVHLDVIDRWGNVVSATPSGGWLQSSPVIPGLGFCLNSRAQMFWLTEGAPTSLAPGRRPRTTLTPGFAVGPDGSRLAFGTPGGDQQDQWQLQFFLRHAVFGMDLQSAIDAPVIHTTHIPSSFYPRTRQPGQIAIESDMPAATIKSLRQRGHDLNLIPAQSAARLTAARRDPDGLLSAAATDRQGQAYAMGR
ncbi:MAG: gamma-glutamyltransferase family protein [Paracoccus sp. (in: a-proteobacteria)]|uniref:gamma-glutamyltransferase family protein n=1 Tax=Paracoccus sp. TaxID=267 RepID=UPI0026DF7728|nr:gamma-glutamyltransferase family protein [Paracoccus sp. (in: a-proteobacteria)]MDO5611895.1 gamma-glutamyltransferase family protein [Paracoccus sp. (in: a-proteobacteria)]